MKSAYELIQEDVLAELVAKNNNRVISPATYTDVMIDIETLDTKPTAVVLSISAQVFDIKKGKVRQAPPFYHTVEIKPQINDGRTTSIATAIWWAKQNNRAYDLTFSEEMSLKTALIRLRGFIHTNCARDCRVWSKSPAFDLVIIKDALGTDLPIWEYNQERDVRTFLWLMSELGISLSSTPTHIAFEDVENQINDICGAYKLLNEKESINRSIEVLDTKN